MNKKSVYILGAGFSKGIGLPVSNEFLTPESFDYLKQQLKSNPTSIKKIQNLQSYVQFRFDNNYCENNIESVLNHVATAKYLEMESMTESDNYSADEIFEDLLWYIARLIKEKSSTANTIPVEYTNFLNHVYENGDSIISFNYDLLLESLLMMTGNMYRYGIDEKKDNEQLVLKLHGSLNWGNCEKCGSVEVYGDLTFEKDSPVSCPLCHSDVVSPLLVPPVIYKDSYYNEQPLVRKSWSLANEQLSQAKKITFIGFSMAQDAYVAELFKLSLSMNFNDSLQCVIVNPTCDDVLRGRYDSVLANIEHPKYIESTFINYVQNYMMV